MAAATESSMMDFDGDPEETDPCTGCKKTLEEGKAFELANHRWHIECFRCGNCKTLLDADANLLLLGDGTLICQSCTYSCFNCGNKIEDLAILTGDQAFCATCFRCRNCKKKIDNLRYARTSMGIFCMECHDMLMARRKKAKDQKTQNRKPVGQRTPGQSPSPMVLDKSLPSLPPSISVSSNEFPMPQVPLRDKESSSRGAAMVNELTTSRQSNSPDSIQRKPVAPSRSELHGIPASSIRNAAPEKDGILLQPHTYSPTLSQGSGRSPKQLPNDHHATDPFSYVPLGFDPTPPTTSSAFPTPQQPVELEAPIERRPSEQTHRQISDQSTKARDKGKIMEGSSKTNRPAALTRDSLHDELQQRPAAAHIAMLDRARKQSAEKSASREPGRSQLQTPVPPSPLQYSASLGDSDTSKQTNSSNSDTSLEPTREKTSDAFKLQDAPKRRRTGSRGSMMSLGLGIENVPGADSSLLNGSLLLDSQSTLTPGPRNPNRLSKAASETSTILAERPAATPAQKSENTTDRTQSTRRKKSRVEDDAPLATSMSVRSTDSTSSQLVHRPPRGDSLARHDSERHHRKENTGPVKSPRNSTTSNSAQPSPKFSVDGIAATSNLIRQALTKGHSNHVSEHPTPLSPKTTPSSAREGRSNSTETSNESKERVPGFLDDSSPSSPQMSNATSAYSEEAKASSTPPPDLLRYSGIGAFTMEDDISRILGATNDSHSAVRRRISTAMQRHGRSFSDNASQTPRKGRVSIHDGSQYDGGSPLHPPPSSTREHIALKSELRRSQQKIAELEARVSSVDDIRSLDTKLREKRSTMAFLDSQREVVLKEMDVFAAHHKRAKESRTPLTAQAFESEMLKSLARELDGLKTRYQPAIEELIHRREELTRQVDDLREEANHLAGQNDQLRKESDELYVKNSKLRDLNDELTGAIKKKSTIDRPPPFDGVGAHGLGIYNPSSTTFASKESKDGRIHSSHGGTHSGAANQLIGEDDHHIHTISTPQVINIRKAQAKKFNWRREGKATLGDMKKGIKSIVKSTNPSGGDVWQPSFVETLPYHQTQMGLGHGSHSNQMASQDGALPHTNLTRSMTIDHNFGLFGKKKQALSQTGKSQSNSNLLDTVAEPPTTLFGSELEARADYERTNIPSIITRCIAEVETRGMDAEGIYRRNGGHSQIRQIQEGVELNGDGHDISDPDLDICSITSILKQYLRNLPTPLITYEAYPDILKAQSIPDVGERIDAMRQVLSTLPSRHHDCLEFLIFHLSRVTEHKAKNLMDAKNLSVCFAPTIMRTRDINDEMTEYQNKNLAVQCMIEYNREIFLAGGEGQSGISRTSG